MLGIRQTVDWIDFFRGSEFDLFFYKKQIKFTPSKEPTCQIYFLPVLLNRKKILD